LHPPQVHTPASAYVKSPILLIATSRSAEHRVIRPNSFIAPSDGHSLLLCLKKWEPCIYSHRLDRELTTKDIRTTNDYSFARLQAANLQSTTPMIQVVLRITADTSLNNPVQENLSLCSPLHSDQSNKKHLKARAFGALSAQSCICCSCVMTHPLDPINMSRYKISLEQKGENRPLPATDQHPSGSELRSSLQQGGRGST